MRSEERQQRSRVCRKDDRTQRADHECVLVERENRRNSGQREQPPAACPDDEQHQRQADERDQHARDERH